MIISNTTRKYIEDNNLDFKNKIIYTNNTHIYNTRLQHMLNTISIIQIPMNITKKHIKKLIKIVEKVIPGIHHYKQHNICKGIYIEYKSNINGFIIKSQNKYLYNFLSNNISMYLLSYLWHDQTQHTITYQLTNTQYKNKFKFKNINIIKKCSICQSYIYKKAIITDCDHSFHNRCLHKWLTHMCKKPNCPNCRNNLDIY